MSNAKLSAVLIVVAAALAGVVGVFYLAPRGPAAPSHGSEAPAVIQLLKDPATVEPFTLTDLDGRTHTSESLRGKVVLINFWATWCPPCLAEIPDLVQLQAKYKDELLIIGVSEDEEPVDVVKKFMADRGVNYPIVMVNDELRDRFPGVIALPTTFVLDREGRLAKKHIGLLRMGETEAVTRALAGLQIESAIEYVEDPGRLSPTETSQITTIPGIDLTAMTTEKRARVVQALNTEKCTCGCDLSVAKCRVDDPTCTVSLPVAQSIVAKY